MRFVRAFLASAAAALLLAACSAGARAPSGPDLAVILAGEPAATLSAYGLFTDLTAGTPGSGRHAL